MKDESEIFTCRQCGHCCQGETTVSLNARDLARMVRYMRQPQEEVVAKYLRVTGSVIQMKTVDGHCIFFTPNGCSIHPGKPWRCRQWPLHPSILTDEANLSAIRDNCPGINRSLAYEEFCSRFAGLVADADYEYD